MAVLTAEEAFTRELDIFGREVSTATQFFFAQMAIHNIAGRNARTLRALNRAPLFWNTVTAALQSAAFMTIGRVFDQSSPHNLNAVLRAAQQHRQIFSKAALAERKRRGSANADEWLEDYLKSVHVPTVVDFRRMRKLVAKRRKLYDAQLSDIRHKYFAHKKIADIDHISALFQKAQNRDLERLILFLNQLEKALWEMLYNGRRPTLRPMPYSVRNLVRRRFNGWANGTVQERIVLDTKRCLRELTAGSNQRMQPTREKRRIQGGRRSARG